MSMYNYGTMSNTSTQMTYAPGQTVFKVVLEKGGNKEPEVRRVRGAFKFDEMVTIVRHMWNSAPKRITIEYIDEENDRVRVGSELEWNEAVQQHTDRGQAVPLRLFVRRGRRTERKRGAAEDSSDSEADVPTDSTVPLAAPASLPVQVPPLMIERALSTIEEPTIPDVEPASPEEYAPVPEVPVVIPAPVAAMIPEADADSMSREHEATIDLLSRLYDCDAAKEMLDMFSRVDFSPVVSRRVDAVAQEVHVDVDKIALRHLTVTRTNLWIGSGLYEKAETTLNAALSVWPDDAIFEYNLACAASLRGNTLKAVEYLRAAVAHGYRNAQQMKRDPDLARAREHPDFASVLDLARGFAAPQSMPAVVPPPPAPVAAEKPAEPATPAPVAPVAPAVESDIDRLLAVFPHLTSVEAAGLLRRFNGNLGLVVNHCLRTP